MDVEQRVVSYNETALTAAERLVFTSLSMRPVDWPQRYRISELTKSHRQVLFT
jgi:hypothetical protein